MIQPKDSDDLIALYDEIFRKSPDFTLGGPPVYGAMHFIMNTQGGFSAFTKEKLNEYYTKMMKTWVEFLDTPKSLEYPNIDHTWLSDDARRYLTSKFFVLASDGLTKIQKSFEDVFICDPTKPHFGFTSYENFFNRRLRNPERDRPVEDINNLSLVSAPCESISPTSTLWPQRVLVRRRHSLPNIPPNDRLSPLACTYQWHCRKDHPRAWNLLCPSA